MKKAQLVDGRLPETVAIPTSDLNLPVLLKYVDFGDRGIDEIAEITGTSYNSVYHAMWNTRNKPWAVKVNLKKGNACKSGKNTKIIDVPDINITQKRLKTKMLAEHDNYTSLAKAVGVAPDTARAWIVDGVIPRSKTLIRIADHYNTTVAYLTGETNKPLRRF